MVHHDPSAIWHAKSAVPESALWFSPSNSGSCPPNCGCCTSRKVVSGGRVDALLIPPASAIHKTGASMANDNQFKTRSRYVATRGVKEYRATIAQLVGPEDIVLELGCEWGTTTSLIASSGASVIGTDISPVCIERARGSYPYLQFEILDAFDVGSAMKICPQPTKIYIDLSGFSGYRSLLDVIALIQMYAALLDPKMIVVKSGALKHFSARCEAWSAID